MQMGQRGEACDPSPVVAVSSLFMDGLQLQDASCAKVVGMFVYVLKFAARRQRHNPIWKACKKGSNVLHKLKTTVVLFEEQHSV